jgi:hypothetical protein
VTVSQLVRISDRVDLAKLAVVDVDVEQHALAAEPQQRGGLPVGADAHVVAHLQWRRMAAT